MGKIRRSGVDVSVDYSKAAGLYAAAGPELVIHAVKPGDEAAEQARSEIAKLLAEVLGGAPDERRVEAVLRMGCAVMRAVRDVRREWGRHALTDQSTGECGLQLRHSVALIEALRAAAAGVCALIDLGPEASPKLAFAPVVASVRAGELTSMERTEIDKLKADVMNRLAHSLLSAPIPERASTGMAKLRWVQRYGYLSMAAEELRGKHLSALLNGGEFPDPMGLETQDEIDGASIEAKAADWARDVSQDAAPLLEMLLASCEASDRDSLISALSTAGWPGAPTGNLRSRMGAVAHAAKLALADINVDGKQGTFVSLLPNPSRTLAWGCVEILAGIGFPPEPAGASSARASRKNPKPYVYGNLVTRMTDVVANISTVGTEEKETKLKGVRKDEGGAAAREYASGRVRPGGLAQAFGYRWRSPSGPEAEPATVKPLRTLKPKWVAVWEELSRGKKRET